MLTLLCWLPAPHLIVCVANDGRPPGADIVHILIAVHVPRVGPLDAVKHDGLAPNGLERAHRGVDAAWQQLLMTQEQKRNAEREVSTRTKSVRLLEGQNCQFLVWERGSDFLVPTLQETIRICGLERKKTFSGVMEP